MRRHRLTVVAIPLTAVLLAACTGTAASPSPEPTLPDGAQYRLRVTAVQALPPAATFSWGPSALITVDGRVLSAGAVEAIFPGPLLGPTIERRLTANGWARIVAAARAAGLLSGARDFTGGQMPPGSQVTRLEIAADGRIYDLSGDASRILMCITTPCDPQPGSPEAFGGFVSRLVDLGSWLGGDIGPEQRHVPDAYAVLVGPPPDDQGLARPPIDWPFEAGFVGFGKALADGSGGRCGRLTGEEATAVRGAFQAATQITKWRDRSDGSFHGLVVRALLPGDGDPCAGFV
jgi:hypothetical protein